MKWNVGAMDAVARRSETNSKNILITDGARVYDGLCKQFHLTHAACNHSQGLFSITRRIHQRKVLVHTGTIDGFWGHLKKFLPSSLASKRTSLAMLVRPNRQSRCKALTLASRRLATKQKSHCIALQAQTTK